MTAHASPTTRDVRDTGRRRALTGGTRIAPDLRRVVVIDDQPEFCDLFAEQLRASACHVEVAYDGATGLDLVQQLQPEIVFIDIVLPNVNGWEIARRLRRMELATTPRLVAISAMQDDAHRTRSLACGFEAHLVKPIRPDALASVLKR